MLEPGALEQLGRLIRTMWPQAKLANAWLLDGGISARMTALKVVQPDGRTMKLVVRQPGERTLVRNPLAAAHEFKLLQVVQSIGIAAPAPIHLDQSGSILPTPFLIMDYIEGSAQFSPVDLCAITCQTAAQLTKIHSASTGDLDLSFLPNQEQRLNQTLGVRPSVLDETLGEQRIRQLLESVWPFPQTNQPRLLHGDFWPGNILWHTGQLAGVIDWEDAELGDPLSDLAISRFDTLMIYGLDAMNEFTQHYQAATGFDFTNLPLWDLAAALRPASRIAEWAAGWAQLGRSDINEDSIRAAHKWFVGQAFQALAISGD